MGEAVRNQSHAGAQGAHGRVLTCEEETACREPAGREHLRQGLEPFSGAVPVEKLGTVPVEKLGTGSHAEGPHCAVGCSAAALGFEFQVLCPWGWGWGGLYSGRLRGT